MERNSLDANLKLWKCEILKSNMMNYWLICGESRWTTKLVFLFCSVWEWCLHVFFSGICQVDCTYWPHDHSRDVLGAVGWSNECDVCGTTWKVSEPVRPGCPPDGLYFIERHLIPCSSWFAHAACNCNVIFTCNCIVSGTWTCTSTHVLYRIFEYIIKPN